MTRNQTDFLAFNKRASKKAWLVSSTIHIVFIAGLTFVTQQASSFSSDDRSASTQNPSVIWTDVSPSKVLANKQAVVKKKQTPIVKSKTPLNENKSHIIPEKVILAPAKTDDTFLVKATEPEPASSQAPAQVVTTATTSNSTAPKSSVELPDTLPSTDASYLNNPKPQYPAKSLELKEKGTVTLKACVNAQGGLDSVSLVKSSRYSRLDQAALEAVKNWRFVPARHGGNAVAQCYELPVNFKLTSNQS